MKNLLKNFEFIIFVVVLSFVTSCVSGTVKSAEISGYKTLDQAIKEAAERMDEQIATGTKVAILNISSPSDQFSTYVIDELTANFLETRKLTIIDRKEIDLIRGEINFQFSGEVSDDSMQEVGKILGAEMIISGSLMEIGDSYRIVIRALTVQTATISVQYRADIANDNRIRALLATVKSPNSGNTTVNRPITSESLEKIEVSFPMAGRWKMTGQSGNNHWTANLIIEEIDNDKFNGYIDWYDNRGIEHIGREYYRGVYNTQFKSIIIRGYRVTNVNNRYSLGVGTYEAYLSRNGYDFESGTWRDGTWEAKWQE